MGFPKRNSYKDLCISYPKHVKMIKAGCFFDVRETDAVILHNVLGYNICFENYTTISRFKTGFPIDMLERVLDQLSDLMISYVVIENYEITHESECNTNRYDEFTSEWDAPINPQHGGGRI